MTIAHLILAHTDPQHIKRLAAKLQYSNDDIYIHIDKKADLGSFRDINDCIFINNRVKVYWASYSIVEATVQSFKEILATGKNYDYINVISGQDYPIKPVCYIHEFLSTNYGQIFMNFESIQNEWKEAIPRLTQYHFVNYRIPLGRYQLEQLVNKLAPVRKLPEDIIPVGRSQWFTTTKESILFILNYLDDNPWIKKYFNLSWAPDEIIFQTILYNSPYKDQMINNNLRYIDWSTGGASPRTLTMDDAESLRLSDKLFARKFSSSSNQIIDYLDRLTT